MSNNEELSSKDESTNHRENRTSSFTECLSMGPMAAASRLMSSLSRQPRTSIPSESNDTTPKSPTTSFLQPIKKRVLPTRNRSVSPISPSSDPSNTSTTNPFLTNSPTTMRNSTTTPSGLNHISKSPTTSANFVTPTPETVDMDFNFNTIYTQLRELAEINCNYFAEQKTDVCRRFERLLIILSHSLELSVPLVRHLTESFHHFDYSPEVKQQPFFYLFDL
jgi:hypothetical protein